MLVCVMPQSDVPAVVRTTRISVEQLDIKDKAHTRRARYEPAGANYTPRLAGVSRFDLAAIVVYRPREEQPPGFENGGTRISIDSMVAHVPVPVYM